MPSTSSPNVERPVLTPFAAERRRRVERYDRLSRTLDTKFRIPGLGIPVGWDSIIGLVPGIGDLVTLAPGIAMIHEGYRIGARRRALVRMSWNTGVDTVIGGIPLLGDAFDLFFKSHRRNAEILQRELIRIEDAEDKIHKEDTQWQSARDRRTEAETRTRFLASADRSTSRDAPAVTSNAGSARATS